MTQDFAFRTDAKPPSRLESWTLATDPADGENGFFFGDPVRMAGPYVASYDREPYQAAVRAFLDRG